MNFVQRCIAIQSFPQETGFPPPLSRGHVHATPANCEFADGFHGPLGSRRIQLRVNREFNIHRALDGDACMQSGAGGLGPSISPYRARGPHTGTRIVSVIASVQDGGAQHASE